jgi:predicted transcriptional regulator
MLADMQESGIPVTYGYISDMHERKAGTSGCTTATATAPGKPIGPGDKCYADNAAAYNQAFTTFFQRLAADGITPSNTLFVISAEEGDQFDGANVGRAMTPTPTGCDGVTVYCSYPAGSIGELQANIKGLLSGTASSATPFDIEPQGASIYVHGQPGLHDPALRQLERDTAAMTADNPYSGAQGEHIVKYQAGGVEQRLLHMQTTDPLRTPSYTMFPVPDYFFATSGSPNVSINSGFAWDHGYYSPNIDVTWSSFVGPGVANNGVDGPTPEQSNESHDPNSTNTVPEASTQGTWVEEVDLRPTMLHLLGLTDDYPSDGQVITQVLADPSRALTGAEALGSAYRMVNSAVGPLATATLEADSRALASGSAGDDSRYDATEAALTKLVDRRDVLAQKMKAELAAAAAGQVLSHGNSQSLIAQADNLMREADRIG